MKTSFNAAATARLALSVLILSTGAVFAQGPGGPVPVTAIPTVAPKSVTIDLDKAVPLPVPRPKFELKVEKFSNPKNGVTGWVVRLPGGRTLATPAYYKGKIFVGGGFGSHEFYAFNATTGALAWKYQTSDDGPTAAVVEDGLVAFNTESCTVYVLDAETGKCLWSEWLGDPLMSQPAISNGRLYMAYPGGQKGHQPGHRLLCADVKTGKHLWDKPITADIITAPVIEKDKVFVTCMDGTSFCLNAKTGGEVWKKANAGTTAPLVAKGQVIMARKQLQNSKAFEELSRMDATYGEQRDVIASSAAPYLQGATNGTIGPQGADAHQGYHAQDASVGFSVAPAAAGLTKAEKNMGISSVSGAWGYQGARAAYKDGSIINTQGTMINTVDDETGKVRWSAQTKGKIVTGRTQVFSPPSLGKDNMYLCSGDGHLVSVAQKDGAVRFLYDTRQPISFQPALAGGNVYIGTANGMVLCIQPGGTDADGWSSWGGNAQHNKQD